MVLSITINTDQHGSLFEIDVWKVDFTPVTRLCKAWNDKSFPPFAQPVGRRRKCRRLPHFAPLRRRTVERSKADSKVILLRFGRL